MASPDGDEEFDRFVASRPERQDDQGPDFAVMAENVLGTDRTPEDILENEDVRNVYLGEEFKL